MNILIVTHWFYPRQIPRAFRTLELYKYLSLSNKVDVIIGDWKTTLKSGEDYVQKLERFNSSDIINKNAKISNNTIIQMLKRIVQFFIGERYIFSSGRFIYKSIRLEKYDAVISIGLPFYIHLLTACKIEKNKKKGKKVVSICDWGDPFVGDKARLVAPYFEYLQKKVCCTFDFVTIPTKNAISYYCKYVNDSSKIKVIPQGMDFTEVELETYVQNQVPHFAYAGIFYKDKRNPKAFLDFLCNVEEDFVFTIYTVKHGEIYNEILKMYQTKLNSKLIIKDMMPRLECIKTLSRNDFLINIDNLSNNQIPSKLIDYSLTERPILSFRQDKIPEEQFYAFLHCDYKQALKIDLNPYNIKIVSEQFMALINGEVRD